jgi:hypothetical protein
MVAVAVAAGACFAPAAEAKPAPSSHEVAYDDIRAAGTRECFAVSGLRVIIATCNVHDGHQEWLLNRYGALLEIASSEYPGLCLGKPGYPVTLSSCADLNAHGYPLRLDETARETMTVELARTGDLLSSCLSGDEEAIARWTVRNTADCLQELVLPEWKPVKDA